MEAQITKRTLLEVMTTPPARSTTFAMAPPISDNATCALMSIPTAAPLSEKEEADSNTCMSMCGCLRRAFARAAPARPPPMMAILMGREGDMVGRLGCKRWLTNELWFKSVFGLLFYTLNFYVWFTVYFVRVLHRAREMESLEAQTRMYMCGTL